MGLATQKAPAPPDTTQPYGLWEIDVRLFDEHMREIDSFTCRQDLQVAPEQFFVRLTRPDGDGGEVLYEDRGVLGGDGTVQGTSGFGGRYTARMFESGAIFSQGTGGDVDFIMVATPTGPDHYRCFRRFEVKRPMVLWGKRVDAGTYFATTEDHLLSTAARAPAEVREPLVRQHETA